MSVILLNIGVFVTLSVDLPEEVLSISGLSREILVTLKPLLVLLDLSKSFS